MNRILNVVIVLGRCRQSRQPFGIRFEEKGRGQWMADWAFPVKEGTARREGYDRGEITGSFGFDPGFPGCPYCRTSSFFKCGCGRVSCMGSEMTVTCPWCGNTGQIGGQVDRLGAGADG
jgi:hypothetical protein